MEIIAVLVVLGVVGYWIYSTSKRKTTKIVEPEAPYKVEATKPIVGSPVVVTAKPGTVEAKVEEKAEVQAEVKPAKTKKPAAKKAKTATAKTTAKKQPNLKRSK